MSSSFSMKVMELQHVVAGRKSIGSGNGMETSV